MKLHLIVLNNETIDDSAAKRQVAASYSCQRNDFHWNKDFTAFRALPLQWWDNESYIAYQARDLYPAWMDEPEPEVTDRCREVTEYCYDGIPF